MVKKRCFKPGCMLDVEYACKCTSSETYCCKKHLELPDRNHSFEPIFIEPCEGTLEFLEKADSSYQEKREKVLASYDHHSEKDLKEFIKEIDTCSAGELNHFSTAIAKTTKILKSEQDPVLGLLSLHPEEAVEKISTIIPISPDWHNREKVIYKEAKTSHWESIINEGNKGLRIFEEKKEKAKGKIESKTQIIPIQNTESTQIPKNSILQILGDNEPQIFCSQNDAELEQEFRKSCLIYESSFHDYLSVQAYQKYVNTYHQKTSVYNIQYENNASITLYIYDTERNSKSKKIFQAPEALDEGTCITQLPNGKLFCYSNSQPLGITLLIDENYEVEVLPSGTPCYYSSAIYFSQSVYCFGGWDGTRLSLSLRFDIVQNRWRKITPMPKPDYYCNSIIFNGNILISGFFNTKLFLYSVEIDSYSIIPYEFAETEVKILINAERLYLIECKGSIYESEIGSDTAWRRISKSTINYDPLQVYCAYNKGEVYIGCHYVALNYYKFDLNEKRLFELGIAE